MTEAQLIADAISNEGTWIYMGLIILSISILASSKR